MAGKRAFAWDEVKAASNLSKHNVPFAYATRVFLDPAMVDIDVSRDGDGEYRRKAVGMIEGRVFTVVYNERAGAIRIISARRCNAKEARTYAALHARSE